MAGAFTGADQHIETGQKEMKPDMTDKFETDVKGVFADGVKQVGIEKFPVFNVSHDEFYSNMTSGRKRQRFKSGGSVQQYMQKTKNSGRPFYVQHVDKKGKKFERKVR